MFKIEGEQIVDGIEVEKQYTWKSLFVQNVIRQRSLGDVPAGLKGCQNAVFKPKCLDRSLIQLNCCTLVTAAAA
jgi:hypothetical protein